MPKHEALTPKAIANRIKAKGLQKLRWYCQMCQKQCRDENGFKCHTMSESHQRQLLLFAENPDEYIDSFSKEFLDDFVKLLSRRFGTKRVHANQVYQEYIADRNHVHMNGTQWETLTDFVKWLGRENLCVVDETEKGWFISYIDRSPDTIQHQEAQAKKMRMDIGDEERMAKFLEKQIERGKEQSKPAPQPVYTELKKECEDEKVAFSMKAKAKVAPSNQSNALVEIASSSKTLEKPIEKKKDKNLPSDGKKRKSALDELILEQELQREKINRKDYWLTPGIVVKVTAKKLGDRYYKKKAVVKEIEKDNEYVCTVKMLDSGDKIKLDQEYLETVIPAIGKKVLVVNGAYRGCEAVLKEVKVDKYCTKIEISSGLLRGRVVDNMQYEDISKLHISS